MVGKHGPSAVRFWRHVRKSKNCWVWTGSIKARSGGYGQFKVGGRPVRAHRFSWELHFGPIPVGMQVCHHCDNPPCVRPDHLFLGTPVHNRADMVRKGRWTPATNRAVLKGRRKLTDDQVREIRCRYAAGDTSYRRLAAEYAVVHTTIVRVVAGRHFGDVR